MHKINSNKEIIISLT